MERVTKKLSTGWCVLCGSNDGRTKEVRNQRSVVWEGRLSRASDFLVVRADDSSSSLQKHSVLLRAVKQSGQTSSAIFTRRVPEGIPRFLSR